MRNSVNEHATLHIYGLPTELLQRIFMFALPRFPSLYKHWEAPLLLGDVRRLWRDLSRAAPLLWSTIEVPEYGDVGEKRRLLTWLERSRDCSLIIRYHSTSADRADSEWGSIISCAGRIEHLDAWNTSEMLSLLLPVDPHPDFDRLKSLHLNLVAGGNAYGIVDLATGLPQLSDIRVRGISFERMVLPSGQLTACFFQVSDNAAFAQFVRAAVNLVDCHIINFGSLAPQAVVVHHEKLEKLTVQAPRSSYGTEFGRIMQWLELPSLRELVLIPVDRDVDIGATALWPQDTFLSFLSRSGCVLSKLWITFGPTQEDILEYLSKVPSVVDLAVAPEPSYDCPRELMQGLTLGSPQMTDLVSNLEHLLVAGEWRRCEEMMDAIGSRFRGGGDFEEGGCLKSVALSEGLVRNDALGGTQERLYTLMDEGLLYSERDDEWLGDSCWLGD
ncbi:hypothetical protein FIBSPDRAFT_1041055 [Athelia psychrophila]|uniref:F-box domain-containing protein n=1 Tax=Athelia psychrophila TaxID=1759441 RepID=A0A166PD63_9AGAM|nr:hypothetical protein FIBSPDRAFT_1041055 [Fibularhizoctonia sp. CBS 109695]